MFDSEFWGNDSDFTKAIICFTSVLSDNKEETAQDGCICSGITSALQFYAPETTVKGRCRDEWKRIMMLISLLEDYHH